MVFGVSWVLLTLISLSYVWFTVPRWKKENAYSNVGLEWFSRLLTFFFRICFLDHIPYLLLSFTSVFSYSSVRYHCTVSISSSIPPKNPGRACKIGPRTKPMNFPRTVLSINLSKVVGYSRQQLQFVPLTSLHISLANIYPRYQRSSRLRRNGQYNGSTGS